MNIEKNKTIKYKLNVNDINSMDLLNQGTLGNILTDISSITDSLTGDPTNENNNNSDPFQSYNNNGNGNNSDNVC